MEYQKKSYQVDTGGLRGELPLTDFQKQQIEEYISSLSLDNLKDLEIIRWVDDRQLNTAYSPGFDLLQIGSDVMPANRSDRQGTLSANTRITWKGSIAHELVGHREAALAQKTQLQPILEEAQASIRAARFAPLLTSTERYTLLRDAIARLHKAGIKVRQIKYLLHINHR
ncbi:hypothetical protein Sta7437_4630 (plasmid) [Stanieria cyanosphaera PCC 7437]|uniref:Uncharacterized protein n=1 Tax=Stanieria cyanosphaera (strain ATCC 29371 / PCC 7437) TaxID=111780 RepID=K9Y019_STAC7|nr:hypothetical protein [Stanieria cyanosphaera]AFZ38088.1 hypothetical protein Sta7437_4630 [Stanieria cyanosphaera PCC 7437]